MSKPIPPDVLAHCAAALKVLAHPSRLRIVELLELHRLTVNELAEELGEAQAIVSQHLARMRAVGLVDVERDGRAAYYRVTNPACPAVLACIRKNFT